MIKIRINIQALIGFTAQKEKQAIYTSTAQLLYMFFLLPQFRIEKL